MAIDVDQFQQHLKYTATRPLPGVLADLKSIAELDQLAQQKKQKIGRMQGWCVAVFIVSILLTIFMAANEVFLLAGLGAIAVVASFIGLAIYGRRLAPWQKLDVPDFRHQLPKQVLEMVMRDVDATTPVAIALDFNSSMIQAKRTDSAPHPYRGGWTRDTFEDPWMTVQGALLDGTSFELSLTEFWNQSQGYKTSASGKRKHKNKIKTKGIVLNLSLAFSRKRYGAVSMLKEDVLSAIHLPDENAHVKSIRVSDRKILLQVKLLPEPVTRSSLTNVYAAIAGTYVPPEKIYPAIASMFLSLYHVLNLAQKLSKAR